MDSTMLITDFELTCRHQSISKCFPRMTDHKCTWSVGVTNQHAWIQSPFLWCMTSWTTRFKPAIYFPPFSLCMTFGQPIFFSPLLFLPLLIYAQPNLDLNLAWRTHFHDWFVFGVRHDLAYFKIDHSKSKVLGHMTAEQLIHISISKQ